ncbi:MAG: DUF1269 domain-containing protein [Candidatus Riflebacteria bacterium]|nr:DUF1269 domain-containing protein [Candidatus Riflebacteria bacterium]
MNENRCVIGVYSTHVDAENAIKDLHGSGINMQQCSIAGQGCEAEQEVVGFYNAGDRMLCWGKHGAFWGGVWGLLAGSGFFVIPGLGPVLAGGALVSSIVGGLQGAFVVGGLNALGAGLYSLGIPRDSVIRYQTAIKENRFVVLFKGTAVEAAQARKVLSRTRAEILEDLVPEDRPEPGVTG